MSIEIREYIGSSMNITESTVKRPINLSESFNEIGPISKGSIIQIIEGIHVGPTRNYTWYTEEALKTSIPTWTKPYQRPLIMHHNETDGKTIGRILSVEYTTMNTRSGTPALIYTCNVPDKEGIEQIKDGRLKTVSIGVIAHDVRCSICGEQLELDEDGRAECGHERGASYKEEICYWMIYKMEAKELSYVIVPSDIYAHNIKTIPADDYLKTNTKQNIKEGVAINMSEASKSIKETTVIEEEVKAGASIVKSEETPETKTEEVKGKEVDPEVKEPVADSKDKEIEELKAEIEKLKADIEQVSVEKNAVIKDLLSVKKDLESATTKVEEITVDLNSKISDLNAEVSLKESVETELAKTKEDVRNLRESELNTLRTTLGKEVLLKESLSSRSNESLMDAICDLKEEAAGNGILKNIVEANDPTINKEKNKNNPTVNVKETKTVGNINVEESLENILSSLFVPKAYSNY